MDKILVLVLCLAATLPAVALDCREAGVTPARNATIAYQARSNDNRCEGFYLAEVGSPSLEVVGLTLGHPDFHPKRNKVLALSAPVKAKLRIQAIGIPLKLYYRMDAELDADATFQWPLDLLAARKLSGRQVAVSARRTDDADVYVPLQWPGSGKQPVLVLRASTNVSTVMWRYAASTNAACDKLGEWETLDAPRGFRGGQAIPLELPATASHLCVEAAAQPRRGNTWLKRLVRIQLK